MINPILVAALVASQAAVPSERCLTRQEAGDIALTAASVGLGALAERCRPHVGPTAFLNTGAEAMLGRLRAAAEPRRTSAFTAFARMSRPSTPAGSDTDSDSDTEAEPASGPGLEPAAMPGDAPEPPVLAFDPTDNPELMSGLVAVMAAAMISSVDTAACADASDLFEALAPLPPENIARLAGAGLGIAGTARPADTGNPLCPA
ncbi:MAG TPA: hypothetical protein VFO69_13455 [Allosphingosinicella sp.]|nr:hypothetical protein [Allosphingosinicella sp.]